MIKFNPMAYREARKHYLEDFLFDHVIPFDTASKIDEARFVQVSKVKDHYIVTYEFMTKDLSFDRVSNVEVPFDKEKVKNLYWRYYGN